ncbi:MAG TPA: diguanylate cyclase [Actinomycetota bacterium]|nr:diguanylate cyclase [Actinomycetota bacterium]
MSLRARLTLFFVAIVVLPVAVVTGYGWSAVARASERQLRSELELSRRSATLVLSAQLEQAADAVRSVARDPALQRALAARDRTRLQAVLDRERASDLLLAVTAPDGRVLARAGRTEPSFLPGVAIPSPRELLALRPTSQRWAMLQRRTATVSRWGCPRRRVCALGTVTAGVWMDNPELQRLAMGTPEADLTVALGGRPVASTVGRLTGADQVPAGNGFGRRRLAGRPVVESAEWLSETPGERARLLVSVPGTATTAGIDSRLLAFVVLLLVVVCLVATALGAALARLVSHPLGELAEQARAIARGDFARPPSAVRSGGEVGELARAFERMRVELGQYLAALRTSRDELARSMNRLGETLSSTHDLPKLLAVVLEAAVQARRAKAGSLLLLTDDRTALVREAVHGLRQRDPTERIPLGQGVAGTVAATGRPMVLASPADAGPHSPAEPTASTQVSVPLLAQGRVLGVLSLYDRDDGEPFTLADAEALTAFAVQAAVAIENVQLHAEAERLSVTDPLTGAWNFRYFERRFEQEIERSRRFGRVLALLMLDLDHFKSVNDRYGHQRGDDVLVEFAHRVTGSVRDIDTFARYGGEEFVLILPETNLDGGLAVAEKLRMAIHGAAFRGRGDNGMRLTVSIGVACFPEHATSREELLRAADEALYEAKLQGRDRVVTAGPRLLPLAARPGPVKGRAARVE